VNKEGFLRTVKEFNAAVQPGTFNPNVLDGKGTKGVEPPKSNWALPIDEPPFMAYPVECTVQFTYGGLATDENARVLATNDSPIPGLYAAGEMVGLYYHRYVGGTSVLRALIFGRIAGANAVDYTRSLR
jgi:Succinate dehydrogenase/fumarate reductase, flavoprotein subunit